MWETLAAVTGVFAVVMPMACSYCIRETLAAVTGMFAVVMPMASWHVATALGRH